MAKGVKTGGRTKGTPNKGKPGRPSLYSKALAETICESLASGLTLKEVLAVDDMPAERTVHTWRRDKSDFAELYTFAMQRHCHHTFDRVWEIAKDRLGDTRVVDGKTVSDTARVQRDRLIVDTGFKRVAKLLPSVYGDLTRLEHTGKDGAPLSDPASEFEVARRLAFILARGAEAADAAKIPQREYKLEPPSEPSSKWEPPTAPRPEPDVFDSLSGRYISAKEWAARWPSPKESPRETLSTDEVVWLYDEDGRPHRTDTRNKEELGLKRSFPQVITRRPGG